MCVWYHSFHGETDLLFLKSSHYALLYKQHAFGRHFQDLDCFVFGIADFKSSSRPPLLKFSVLHIVLGNSYLC